MERSPPLSQEVRDCIEACQSCHAECLETVTHICVESGGRHTEPSHVRLMLNCAGICATAADFMLSRSAFHQQLCGLCAEVCEACADDCEQIGGMDRCVQACRSCAESCRRMAGGYVMSQAGRAAQRTTRPGSVT